MGRPQQIICRAIDGDGGIVACGHSHVHPIVMSHISLQPGDSLTAESDLRGAISTFGSALKAKLKNSGISGAPEDQLRSPLEVLFREMSSIIGFPSNSVGLVGETTLAHLATRPDYAVTVNNALVGFIEVKAPGKGSDPRRFSDPHDKRQWEKLKSLPNLIYTDGNSFSLWRDGTLQGTIVTLSGNVESEGAALSAPPTLLPLFTDFLRWHPIPPRTAKQLAEVSARLCRLLRDEVSEELNRGSSALSALATEWRSLLFPQASDAEFSDGYAQAVTFGLLVARARDIDLNGGIDKAALELRKSNSLIATALRLLTDDPDNQKALKTSLDTLTRVLGVVDWSILTKADSDAWLYFYEDFLGVYDNALRKRTGSYYTPPEVVHSMVRLVHEALQDTALFDLPAGLASSEVTVADPAVGTGTYLLGVLRHIAKSISDDQGPGAVGPAITAAVERLIGFELQFGPFAVAQLRLIAELQTLTGTSGSLAASLPTLRLYITDTLGDPYAAQTQFSGMVAPIGDSRQKANAIKRGDPITVVIGNPPYKDKAKGLGGWVEAGSSGREAPMDRWSPPRDWGVGLDAKHLKNLYVYFWRWATWKVFGSGHGATTGEPEKDHAGIVCYITASGFLNGDGFQKMRDDLRRDCSDIWIIDCSPEGNQPEVATRIFQDVQREVCIVLAARKPNENRSIPARVRYRSLPKGKREAKFTALNSIGLNDSDWLEVGAGWRDTFAPVSTGAWADFPRLEDLFVQNTLGSMPGRTWVISPDERSLKLRWQKMIGTANLEEKERLFHPHMRGGKPGDKHIHKKVAKTLGSIPASLSIIASESGDVTKPCRYGFRSFDRQWIIPDARLINQPSPILWDIYSPKQVHLTALQKASPTSGPAISFTSLIPDHDHYKGSFAGRVFPLWANAAASESNVDPALLKHLTATYGKDVSPEDLMAYVAAVMSHSAFTERFSTDLVRPGLRLPLTASATLFAEATSLGREVIWLQSYGERFIDASEDRPHGAPRLAKGDSPTIPAGGSIPGAPEPLPDTMEYDPVLNRLHIGKGYIDNVPMRVWTYEVSGKNILRQWFSYRRLDRSRPVIGDRRPPSPLDKIQPEHWPAEYTSDLIDLLNVLGRITLLEPLQAGLLDRICSGALLGTHDLSVAGSPSPQKILEKKKNTAQHDLFG